MGSAFLRRPLFLVDDRKNMKRSIRRNIDLKGNVQLPCGYMQILQQREPFLVGACIIFRFGGNVPAIMLLEYDPSTSIIFKIRIAIYDDFPDLICGQLIFFRKNNPIMLIIYNDPPGLYRAVSKC